MPIWEASPDNKEEGPKGNCQVTAGKEKKGTGNASISNPGIGRASRKEKKRKEGDGLKPKGREAGNTGTGAGKRCNQHRVGFGKG